MPTYLYVALQDADKILILALDAATGHLSPQGEVPVAGGPSHLALSPDRQVLYVGCRTGPAIASFRIDPASGRLSPNTPLRVEPTTRLGPRHFCWHPTLPVAYFANEQGSSVTADRLDPAAGTLSALQTLSTLPAGFSARNTCSQIHLTPAGRFLYVGNRGHNSLAGFAVDAATGQLTALGQVATEAVPSAFGLDPAGHFVVAAGGPLTTSLGATTIRLVEYGAWLRASPSDPAHNQRPIEPG